MILFSETRGMEAASFTSVLRHIPTLLNADNKSFFDDVFAAAWRRQ